MRDRSVERHLTQPTTTFPFGLSFRTSSALSSALMTVACQSSREVKTRFARLMPALGSIIPTAASDTSRVLPIAMLEQISLRAASISDVCLNGLSAGAHHT